MNVTLQAICMIATIALLLAAQVGAQSGATVIAPPQPAPETRAPGAPDRTEEDVQRSSAASDVVVTARRREERLSDVPTAASVIDATSLNDRGGATGSGFSYPLYNASSRSP